jgi:hypothetical protein
MTRCEFSDWYDAAPEEAVRAVLNVMDRAMTDWDRRAGFAAELADLEPWCRSAACPCRACVGLVAEVAALAAAEVELVRLIWPGPLDRPLGQASARRAVR